MESVKDWADSLYLRYSPKMVAAAMRTGFTIEEAEDLTQDDYPLWWYNRKKTLHYIMKASRLKGILE